MSKEEFLNKLRVYLSGLPESDRDEILRDQEEFIRDAVQSGRSETEAVASLGSPRVLASNLIAEARIQKFETSENLNVAVRNSWPAVVALLTLAPLNLIFVLGPFLFLVGGILAGWGSVLFGVFISVVGIVIYFSELVGVSVEPAIQVSTGLLGFGVLGLFLFGTACMLFITKFFLLGTVKYLKWNLKLVRGLSRV